VIRIAVTSLKGGAGVTAVVAGFAQAAAQQDFDVLCVDADTQDTLKYHLGLVGLATGEKTNSSAARISLRSPSQAFDRAADVVLWDLPRSAADTHADVLTDADAVVLVVPASATSVTMAAAVRRFLTRGENRFVLINFEDGRIPLKTAAADYLDKHFHERMLGRIRHDESIEEAVANLELLSTSAPYSAGWADIRNALTRLLQSMNELPVNAVGQSR